MLPRPLHIQLQHLLHLRAMQLQEHILLPVHQELHPHLGHLRQQAQVLQLLLQCTQGRATYRLLRPSQEEASTMDSLEEILNEIDN